jgi:hypothetical protein
MRSPLAPSRDTEHSPTLAATRFPLAPEAQLLLLTAAVSPSDAATRRVVSTGIDWDMLCALAEHERATSIVLRELGRLDAAESASGFGDLRQRATGSLIQALHLEQLLHRTIDGLMALGIEPMLLKGAGLAYTAYASFADRPMGDLDVLVRAEQAERAWTGLQTLGWTWNSARWAAGLYVAHQHRPPLVHEPGGFRLEIHDDLLPRGHPFRFSVDALWERAQRVQRGGRVFTVPHPLHQLWHVCVHFAWSHEMEWGTWRALRDTAVLARAGHIAWPEFVDFARDTRAGTCCFWTLRLARRLAGADVPDDVLAALRPPRPAFMLEQLERHYIANLFPTGDRCPSVWLARRLWAAGVLPGRSGHGRQRPWHGSEKWITGSAQAEPESVGRALLARLRTVGAGLNYLRRIRRVALPGDLYRAGTPGDVK